MATIHGATRNGKTTPEYQAFRHALTRCNNPNYPYYYCYGGRGIKVLFASFGEFYAEVGDRPNKRFSLDRIDVNGHYEPGNVRWVDDKTQQRNRTTNHLITFNGETLCIAEWAERLNVKTTLISMRLFRNWCVPCTLTIPKRQGVCPHRVKLATLDDWPHEKPFAL